VRDVVAALLMAMASPAADGHVFNLGSEPATLRQVAELLTTKSGSGSVRPIPYPEHLKSIEIGDYIGDYRKIESVLGWRPQVALEPGIAETIEYYRQHRAHYWQREAYP